MKVLILTITAGEGHNATAKAIHEELAMRGVESEVLDVYQKTNRLLYSVIAKGYLMATSDLKKLYAAAYSRLERRKSDAFSPSITRATQKMIMHRVYNRIREYKPDVIVYTHVFAGVLLDVIKEKKGLSARSVGITTDFTMHPFWEEVLRTDRVVIPNEMLIPAAMRKGLTEAQITPTGIPIRTVFSELHDKSEARRKLGLDPNLRTLLLMGGSMGYGNMPAILCELDELEEDFQIIVVCGNNKKAKDDIDSLSLRKRILSFGFTREIDVLMDAADCIVTKPGGLTTSEALAKRLPMIICNPIPGQEDRNTEFLLNTGVALKLSKTVCLSDLIYQLFHNSERIEIMQRMIDLIRKPQATASLIELILQLGEEKLSYESIADPSVTQASVEETDPQKTEEGGVPSLAEAESEATPIAEPAEDVTPADAGEECPSEPAEAPDEVPEESAATPV